MTGMPRDRFEVVTSGRRHALVRFPEDGVEVLLPRGQVLRLAARLAATLSELEPMDRADPEA